MLREGSHTLPLLLMKVHSLATERGSPIQGSVALSEEGGQMDRALPLIPHAPSSSPHPSSLTGGPCSAQWWMDRHLGRGVFTHWLPGWQRPGWGIGQWRMEATRQGGAPAPKWEGWHKTGAK